MARIARIPQITRIPPTTVYNPVGIFNRRQGENKKRKASLPVDIQIVEMINLF